MLVAAAVPEVSGVGWPPLVCVPDGDGEPEAGDPDCVDGDPDWGEPDPLCGDGDPDCGEGDPDWGGGLPELPVGGGGDCGGWLRNSRMAISTASAANSSISSQETKMVRHPARSNRPGQGSGHSLVSPGFTLSIQ